MFNFVASHSESLFLLLLLSFGSYLFSLIKLGESFLHHTLTLFDDTHLYFYLNYKKSIIKNELYVSALEVY